MSKKEKNTVPSEENPASDEVAAPPADVGPLFYRHPTALSSIAHASWKLRDGDFDFAAQVNSVPVVVGEFAVASRTYPIVFAGTDAAPLALLGLEQENLFVNKGEWSADKYVPAYVRRYPFVFMHTTNPDGFALAIDTGSGRVAQDGAEGVPLFQDNQPAEVVRQAMQFCGAFTAEHQATRDFSEQLRSHDLLMDRQADVTLPNGRKLALQGFQVVDAEKFSALPEAVVIEWHRKGWLGLVHFHLASLGRFTDLLSKQGERESSRVSAD